MWARVVETMMGLWLLASPFIFRHPEGATSWWANDFTCGFLTVTLALASYWKPLHRSHLGLIAVGTWLVGFGYLAGTHPNPPALQNNILVGLTLLMFAIIPNHASLPPRSWRPYGQEEGADWAADHARTAHGDF